MLVSNHGLEDSSEKGKGLSINVYHRLRVSLAP